MGEDESSGGDQPMGEDESTGGGGDPSTDEDNAPTNDGQQFARLPTTDADRIVEGRPTRDAVLSWWEERFGVDPAVFDDYTFWERGSGKLWAFRGEAPSPVQIQGLGMTFLRTRQEHWKPTLEAIQRFGEHASKNVISLSREQAATFVAGRDQELAWDGDWGYLVVTHDLAEESVPLGVGLFVYGELRSQVPKGRRREL